MLDETGAAAQLLGKPFEVMDWSEAAVKDQVVLVRVVGRLVCRHPDDDFGAELLEEGQMRAPAEGSPRWAQAR